MVKTKIICTLGPVSSNETVLRKMMLEGMDVARLNFSHGTHEQHDKNIRIIRELNKKYRRHIKILGDLEGYRVRIGNLKDQRPIELKKGNTISLTQSSAPLRVRYFEKHVGEGNIIPFDYEGPLGEIK